jgi:hypothetical protein
VQTAARCGDLERCGKLAEHAVSIAIRFIAKAKRITPELGCWPLEVPSA